jgi:hypothetical protein
VEHCTQNPNAFETFAIYENLRFCNGLLDFQQLLAKVKNQLNAN